MTRTIKTTEYVQKWSREKRGSWHRSDTNETSLLASTASGIVQYNPRRIRTADPDWKVLVSRNQDASGYYFRRETSFQPKWSEQKELCRQSGVTISSNTRCFYLDDPSLHLKDERVDFALRDQAIGRLKNKIGSRSKQVNVLVPLAELRELRGVIRALTYHGLDIAHALLQIKRTKGKSAFQYAAHAWLQWSFAIAPTVSEAIEISDAIQQHIEQSGGGKYTDYGVAKKEWTTVRTATFNTGYYAHADVVIRHRHKLSYRSAAGYTLPLTAGNLYDGRESFGLEFGALVPTMWELAAFSWLFDYFSTAGAFLEDVFVSDPQTAIYTNITRKYRCDITYEFANPRVTSNQGGMSSVIGEPSSAVFTEIERHVLPKLPRRQLRFKSSDEVGKNAVNKLLNLCSIVVGGKALSNRF